MDVQILSLGTHIFMSVYFIKPLLGTEKGHFLWAEKFPQESQSQKLGMESPCSVY